jgi:hypothetical protein
MNQMSYYSKHREERLAYQKLYNKSEYYKAYQQNYFIENKERIYEYNKQKKLYKRKPLAQYKIDKLEAMLRRKLREYNKSIIVENVIEREPPPVISKVTIQKDFPPLQGYIIKNNGFILTF